MKLPRVELQPRHLLVAYRMLARPGWPDTLAAALHDRSLRPLLEGLARNRARAELLKAPEPQPQTARTTACRRHRHAWTFDARRAAAGDIDD